MKAKRAILFVILVHVLAVGSGLFAAHGSESYVLVESWPKEGVKVEIKSPRGVGVDSAGNVFVVAATKGKIVRFDKHGKLRAQWGPRLEGGKELDIPYVLCVDRHGMVYVVDMLSPEVFRFDPMGKLLATWPLPHKGAKVPLPGGIAVEPSGNVLVVDSSNNRIHRFGPSGKLLETWGSKGDGDGEFGSPEGVAVDKNGNIFVVDRNNQRVQKFDSTGRLLLKWGERGYGEGQFFSSSGIGVDSKGNVFVVDGGNHRIQKFDSSGRFLTEFGSSNDELYDPTDVAVDSAGNVYVTDQEEHKIQKYRPKTAETPPEPTKDVPAEPGKEARPTKERKISVDDVVLLKELGIEEDTILKKIQDSGTTFSPEEVAQLKKARFSETFLAELQKPKEVVQKKLKLTVENVVLLKELGIDEESILKKIEDTATTFSAEDLEQLKKAGFGEAFLAKLGVVEEKKEEKKEEEKEEEEVVENGLAGSWQLKAPGIKVDLVLGDDGSFTWHYEAADETEDLKGTWKKVDDSTIEVQEEGDPTKSLMPCKVIDPDTLQITVEGVILQFNRVEDK